MGLEKIGWEIYNRKNKFYPTPARNNAFQKNKNKIKKITKTRDGFMNERGTRWPIAWGSVVRALRPGRKGPSWARLWGQRRRGT